MKSKQYQFQSLRFLLTLKQQEIINQYPSLGQAWFDKVIKLKKKNQQMFYQRYIQLQYVILYKNYPEEPITYKAIKIQRLLSMLCLMTQKLQHFQRIQLILRIQNSKISSKKDSTNQKTTSKQFQKKLYYLQKGQTFLQNLLKNYNTVIGILKLHKNNFHNNISLSEYILYYLANKKKQAFYQLDKQLDKQLGKQLGKQLDIENNHQDCLKLKFIEKIKEINQKLGYVLKQTMVKLKQEADKNQMILEFLCGNGKFYKIQNLKFNTYGSQKEQKNALKKIYNKIQSSLFNVTVQLNRDIRQFQYFQQNLQNLQNFDIVLNWNLESIEDTCLSFQYIYQYLYNPKSHLKQTTAFSFDEQNYVQNLQNVIKKIQNWNINVIFQTCKQMLVCYFNEQELIQIQQQFGLIRTENIFSTFNSEMKAQSDDQSDRNWFLNDRKNQNHQSHQSPKRQHFSNNDSYNLTSDDSTYKIQNNLIKQSIQRQDCLEIQSQMQKLLQKKLHIHQISPSQSGQLLSQLYRYYFVTIMSFIQCQKLWFFKTQRSQTINTRVHYSSYLEWLPLIVQQSKNINKHLLSDEKINTFTNYMTSTITTLIDIKAAPLLTDMLLGKKKQNLSYLIKDIKSQINEQIMNYDQNCQLSQKRTKFFLYHDVKNILTYQNMSFQNIQHCHYYYKYIKNDSRHEFQDRSWVQYHNVQIINLLIKQKKCSFFDVEKQKNSKELRQSYGKYTNQHQESSNQIINSNLIKKTRRLISIPVRGRYCQHLDFFDLRQVYSSIYPIPYCEPQEIQCPKCMLQISFDQLIYLHQVEIILQIIKLFYLQKLNNMKRFIPQIQEKKKKNDGLRQSKEKRNQKFQKRQRIFQGYDQDCQFHIQQLKLHINHKNSTAKIKGKYSLLNNQVSHKNQQTILEPTYQQCSKFNCESKINFSSREIRQNRTNKKRKYKNEQIFKQQPKNTIDFEQNLHSQIYQTLLNPNKNFKNISSRLKKFLSCYGNNKKITKSNFSQEISTQDMQNENINNQTNKKPNSQNQFQNNNPFTYQNKQVNLLTDFIYNQKRIKSFDNVRQSSRDFQDFHDTNDYIWNFQKPVQQNLQFQGTDDNDYTIQDKIQIVNQKMKNHWTLYEDLQKGTVAI